MFSDVYYGSIKAVPGLQPTAGPTSTTAMPTTRTFNHPEYNHDLALIAHDILVVVNQKTSGGITALTQVSWLMLYCEQDVIFSSILLPLILFAFLMSLQISTLLDLPD